MTPLVLLLIPVSLAIASVAVFLILRASRRLGAFDSAPMEGQTKLPARAIPNTGGIGIVLGIALPLVAALVGVLAMPDTLARLLPAIEPHLAGVRDEAGTALWILGGLIVIHLLGVYDDRRPLGPGPKLAVMLLVPGAVIVATDTRLLTMLDAHSGGAGASIVVTTLWCAVVINAINFMDNMDGIAGGSVLAAAACFLVATLGNGQWFVASVLALLVGAVLGFLLFNKPPARIFMGDGGSLAIGYLLAMMTVRTTYYDPARAGGWYALLMPIAVLAVPLYDFVSVTTIRLAQGRSPFKGDLQHLSHRLVRRGLSGTQTMLVIAGLTGVTGIAGIVLGSLVPWQAALVGVQIALLLALIALFEFASPATDRSSNGPAS